jgi:hypothetical protein
MPDHPDRPRSARPGAGPREWRTASIRTPDEVIRAVPYLLGFHPRESLVLLALAGSRLVLTVRLDLPDAAGEDPAVLRETLAAVARAQADRLLGVVVTDTPLPDSATPGTDTGEKAATGPAAGPRLPYTELVEHLGVLAAGFALNLADTILLHKDRWWSYQCDDPSCCPPAGRPVDTATTSFETLAVTYGTVPLDNRDELARLLEPVKTLARAAQIERAARALDRRIAAAARTADPDSWQQPVIEDLLAAAGTPDAAVTMASAARWGVALRMIPVRDAAWAATDARQIPDPQWWRLIGRMLPAPFCAAPLFLFGWSAWRNGNGALANVCTERVLAADPDYSAARLLDLAVRAGVNPLTTPPLDLTS